MATYKHLRSSTANKRPTTSITDGQLAINTNTASPGLFFKDSAGTGIVKVGPVHVGTTAPNATPAAGGSSGNYLGEQWLDTSVSPSQMKVWNGSAWVGIVADELPVSKLQDGDARQLLQTDAAGTGVEWTSNVDVPGTLDVTGATTLDSTLTVPLGSAASPTLRFSGDANSGLYSPGADQVAVSTGGTGRLRVDATGVVHFEGTSASVFINPSSDTNTFQINRTNSTILFNGTGTSKISKGGLSPGNLQIESQNSSIEFLAGGERLRITSAGLVGIGVSAPQSQLQVLDQIRVSNSAQSQGSIVLGDGGSTTFNVGIARWNINTGSFGAGGIGYFSQGTGNVGGHYFYTGDAAVGSQTARMVITPAGDVGIGTTSPNASSKLHVADGDVLISKTSGYASLFFNFIGVGTTRAASIKKNYDSPFDLRIQGGNNSAAAPICFDRADGFENARFDDSGRLLVGTSSARSNFFNATISSALDVEVSTDALIEFSGIRNRNNADGAVIALAKSRGTTAGSNTIVTSGDGLGRVSFQGSDGSEFVEAAVIQAEVDGTPGANDMPGRLVFFSGTTVSYNGAHLSRWSQIPGIDPYNKVVRPEILRGTVMSNLDEMCDWTCPTSGECQDNEQLNKTKISDVEGDKNVAGIFQAWDDDDDTWVNDYYLAMTGDFVIRIAAGTTVERGDLLMSAGDGTAKPQADDLVRSCTVAKVTSTNVSCTYADGSYCVPCVLMAC
jgi:hypothetical protein